jgi:uncharacterized surface protein with fasciclin (FAS1) repeats
MKTNKIVLFLTCLFLFAGIMACKNEANEVTIETPDAVVEQLKTINNISIFTDLMRTAGKGLLDTTQAKTLFIPTDEAFIHLDIATKRDYDKATMIAFLASQMTDKVLPSANFKSGKMTTSNLDTVRVYDGSAFTQIEDALVEGVDLKLGNLMVHLVDRIFKSEKLISHNHNTHATHDHNMTDNCGAAGASVENKAQAVDFRNKTSVALNQLPTWLPTQATPKTLPKGFVLMGGRNNGLPYIHYFSKENMEDNKFMNPDAPEGLMCGLTADGVVYPISAVYLTREAKAADLHTLNCIYMFHEHDGLPGVMMHVFHDKYPSTNGGFDHEADPILVRKMKVK